MLKMRYNVKLVYTDDLRTMLPLACLPYRVPGCSEECEAACCDFYRSANCWRPIKVRISPDRGLMLTLEC